MEKLLHIMTKLKCLMLNFPINKQHKESKMYKAGKKLVYVKLPWGRLGLTICYDLRFPQIYRDLSKKI